MFKPLCTAALILMPTLGFAQSYDSLKTAKKLGNLLASEEICALIYNQDAIGKWIDENTDPADMGFTSGLNLAITGSEYSLQKKSKSAKTAHCRSITRTAKHYGFVE